MKKYILKEILRQSGDPCLTVIVPTELSSFSDREKIELKLKKAATGARKQLMEEYGKNKAENLIKQIEVLIDRVDLSRLQKGLGFFVSADYRNMLYFPFEVKERVVVNGTFDVRDIIANLNKLSDYHVLHLSQGKTRLFRGDGNRLEEVEDGRFPQEFEDEYQYNTIRPARPGQQFYKNEESKIDQARLDAFLRKVDRLLDGYFENEPLVIMGTPNLLSTFKRVSDHRDLVVGEVEGNYDRKSPHEISKMSWKVLEESRREEMEKTIRAARDALFVNRAVSGIQEVWQVAKEGRGDELLVEKDFATRAYVGSEKNRLVLDGPPSDDARELPDAVEEVMNILLMQKDTEIHVVENGALEEYGRIILTTKY